MTAQPRDPNTCAHCHHPRHAHIEGGECIRCMVELRTIVEPRHDFEPEIDPQRTYLANVGKVYSPAAGTRFTIGGREYVVRPACHESGEGLWVCITHAVTMTTNALKDYHCYHPSAPGGGPRTRHALVYNCYMMGPDGDTHGPERAGPAEWMGEEVPR